MQADLAQARASVAEAEAALAEAKANAQRRTQLQAQGFISSQATIQFLTAEQTAAARLAAARARVQAEEVRLAQTRMLAPDDGVISARSATVGSLTQPGQELFRLIRGGRLEWRAEVTGTELHDNSRPACVPRSRRPSGDKVEGTRAHGRADGRPGDAQRHRLCRPAAVQQRHAARRHVCARRVRARQRQAR